MGPCAREPAERWGKGSGWSSNECTTARRSVSKPSNIGWEAGFPYSAGEAGITPHHSAINTKIARDQPMDSNEIHQRDCSVAARRLVIYAVSPAVPRNILGKSSWISRARRRRTPSNIRSSSALFHSPATSTSITPKSRSTCTETGPSSATTASSCTTRRV